MTYDVFPAVLKHHRFSYIISISKKTPDHIPMSSSLTVFLTFLLLLQVFLPFQVPSQALPEVQHPHYDQLL